ncbi:MAG: restriction endonuclease [Bacteroidales bacterium]|jgi:hypothetical protein|nr:restriction endonuclease [Bacteroidales bacterium]
MSYKKLADKIFTEILTGTNRNPVINIESEYIAFFNRHYSDEDELIQIKKLLFVQCDQMRKQGFPEPLYQSISNEKVLITWFHSRYNDYSQLNPPNENFYELLDWVHKCDGNEFLLACAAYLASIKSNKIFITDKSNDGGIDLIAINYLVNQIQTLFFVQAKTKQELIVSREQLLQEIGKMHNLPQKEIYNQYFKHINREINGCSFTYIFITNGRLKDDAIKEAFYSKSIFVNDLKLSLTISNSFSLAQILEVGNIIKEDRNSNKFEADLEYDIANKFSEFL